MDGLDWNRLGRALGSLDELLDAAERGKSVPSMAIASRTNQEAAARAMRLEPSVGLTNGNAVRPLEALEMDRGLINGFAREGGDRAHARRGRPPAWGARSRRRERARATLERKAKGTPPGPSSG